MYAVVTHMFRISIARLYDNKKEKKKENMNWMSLILQHFVVNFCYHIFI